uniref:Glycosyl transferase group 1 n=1 Tax=Cyanothece sp. (strain PCC 7425 / ATCC 29141) TaxID=395961 RepID=B8HLJ1_CYAP4
MRIGHFDRGLRVPGGIASYVRRLGEAQLQAGHDVFYFDTLPVTEPNNLALHPLTVVQTARELLHHCRNLQLDVLHLHSELRLPAVRSTPIVRTIHAHTPYCPSGSRYFKRWQQPCDRQFDLGGCLWGHLVDRCGSIRPANLYAGFQNVWQEKEDLKPIPLLANSQFVRDQMIRSGYASESIHVLYLPAPAAAAYSPPPAEGICRFLYLGRITPEKGWDWLLRSLAQVKVPVQLDVAGLGNAVQEQAFHQLIATLNLQDRVTFHGWVSPSQAIALLQSARALVFPSLWHEPAGLVNLEAAATGRAVIASRVGGIPEYAGQLENALLVEPNDVKGLTQALEQLAGDWHLAVQLGRQGQDRVEHFSLDGHVKEVLRLYELAQETQSR